MKYIRYKYIRYTKNHTHVKKVEHTSEFPFGIYWWTLKNPKNQNFEKMNKASEDIIISHLCTKNHDRMMYAYSDMECGRHILGHFLLF